ncbi:BLUF domain-containing protein [Sphingobium sp.]|uniref:BLUF domain-containing protein n=1 Tax=Sphingobium sp. TaxID=1912891 RepID=UPI003BB69CBA
MSLRQIMYISSATGQMTAVECAAIASASTPRNAAQDVTGLLLFNGKRFLQVLEGPTAALDPIYDRIRRDGRHQALVKLRDTAIETREFGQWAMAFDDPASSGPDLKDKVAALLHRAGPTTSAHFIGSAEMHRHHTSPVA